MTFRILRLVIKVSSLSNDDKKALVDNNRKKSLSFKIIKNLRRRKFITRLKGRYGTGLMIFFLSGPYKTFQTGNIPKKH